MKKNIFFYIFTKETIKSTPDFGDASPYLHENNGFAYMEFRI